MASFLVRLGQTIERAQDRQCQSTASSPQLDQDGQHHPFVPPPPGYVGMRRAHSIALPPLAIDLLPGVLRDRIVAAERNRAARKKATDHMLCQNPRQIQTRPATPRENTVIAAQMTVGQSTGDSQQAADRTATDTTDLGTQQNLKAGPDRLRKLNRPFVQDSTHTLRHPDHRSFMAWGDSRLVHLPDLPARRLSVLLNFQDSDCSEGPKSS